MSGVRFCGPSSLSIFPPIALIVLLGAHSRAQPSRYPSIYHLKLSNPVGIASEANWLGMLHERPTSEVPVAHAGRKRPRYATAMSRHGHGKNRNPAETDFDKSILTSRTGRSGHSLSHKQALLWPILESQTRRRRVSSEDRTTQQGFIRHHLISSVQNACFLPHDLFGPRADWLTMQKLFPATVLSEFAHVGTFKLFATGIYVRLNGQYR